ALDVATDYFPHFAGIEWLVDVIVRAEPERFLGGLQRTESGQHDNSDVRVYFADPPQTIDAARARHPDVGDHGVGLFFLQQLDPVVDAVRGINLIVRFEKHAQAFARTHLVIDDEDLGKIG